MGDFNSLPSFAAPAFLREYGLVDSFASKHADADKHPTWEWPLASGKISLRIDYIFHDATLETEFSQVSSAKASDHFLLTSRLRLLHDIASH